jgi:superfamily II DNA helicase RecQ
MYKFYICGTYIYPNIYVLDVYAPVQIKLEDIQSCAFSVLYAHPESLLNSKLMQKLLRSPQYEEKVCAIVVDEVHMVYDW